MSTLPHLVLAGCGHAQLFVLEALARGDFPAVAVTLVNPAEEYVYSGMLAGVIAGSYTPEQARLHPRRVASAAGARFIRDAVVHVDPVLGRVHLAGGGTLEFDLLSLNVGAPLVADHAPGVAEHAIRVKPVRDAMPLRARAEAAVECAPQGAPARIVFVGAGAAGFELSVTLDAGLRARFGGGRHRITLLDESEEPLSEHPVRARRLAGEVLARRGIEFRALTAAARVEAGGVESVRGVGIPADLVIWTTGPRAHGWIGASGLPTDDRGFLRVRDTLQADGFPTLFGAGDCVGIVGHPEVAKAGVYAVREGPVLARNLAAALRGEALESYRPQANWLSLLNTGDGRALLSYRGLAARARPLWWWKDGLDRRFMRRFHRLEQSG